MLKRVLTDNGEFEIDAGAASGLVIGAADLERVTGWMLKREGLCKDELCVPFPGWQRVDGRFDVEAFWRKLGHPVLSDDAGETWVLGAGAEARLASLATLEAPDFELPDVDGKAHRLSELRGKKVFLATWASW